MFFEKTMKVTSCFLVTVTVAEEDVEQAVEEEVWELEEEEEGTTADLWESEGIACVRNVATNSLTCKVKNAQR